MNQRKSDIARRNARIAARLPVRPARPQKETFTVSRTYVSTELHGTKVLTDESWTTWTTDESWTTWTLVGGAK